MKHMIVGAPLENVDFRSAKDIRDLQNSEYDIIKGERKMTAPHLKVSTRATLGNGNEYSLAEMRERQKRHGAAGAFIPNTGINKKMAREHRAKYEQGHDLIKMDL